MAKSSKGSSFEREICKKLSLWWTEDERDDVFWRSTTSGARATSRAKQGKKTAGSEGDITAIDPIGLPLIQLITFEVKRGYTKSSIQDLLDLKRHHKDQKFQEWYLQVRWAQEQSKAPYWAIISRRDQRAPMIWLPMRLGLALEAICCANVITYWPSIIMRLELQGPTKMESVKVIGLPLLNFLTEVTPYDIIKLAENKT